MARLLFSVLILFWFISSLFAQPKLPQENSPPESPDSQQEPSDNEIPLTPNMKAEGEEDTSRVTDLPLLEEMQIPSASELLTGQKVDWIILDNQRVVVSRPIKPRPRTLEIQAEKLFELRTAGIPGNPAKREAFEEQIYELRRIRGGFIDAVEAPEFMILTSRIDKIWHHEDLLLRRADILMDQKKYPEAYELLFTLQNIDSDWPGLAEAHHRLIFLNASQLLETGEAQAAFTQWGQLHSLDPDYPELSEKLTIAASIIIDDSIEHKEYRKSRHFLHRLQSLVPSAPAIQSLTERFQTLSESLLNEAIGASESGDQRAAVLFAREAATVWPKSRRVRETFDTFAENYQILRVGVLHPAGVSHANPFPTRSDLRAEYLKSRKLFEVQSFDDSAHYRASLVEQWEPTELGRNLDIRLKTAFRYWSSQRPLTAIELAEQFHRQLAAGSPDYNERLSGFVKRVQVLEPYRLEIEFRRTPLSPEAVLSLELSGSNPDSNWFQEISRSASDVSFRRSIPEPQEVPQRHVTEIREQAYPNREEILRAMFRGEIDYIPDLPVHHAAAVDNKDHWWVRRYQIPETHVLQFHTTSLLGQSNELRRALLFAIDRKQLLAEKVLREAPAEFGRLTTSVFPQKSRAFNPLVSDISPDPLVARSLTLAAQKTAGGKLPVFRLAAPHDSNLQPVLKQMIDDWKRVGITVEVISSDDQEPENWDLAYRVVSLSEPLSQLWPFLTMKRHSRVADLQILPGWLRQELIQLELATNWNDARQQLHKLHQALWSEVFYLPLWELERFSMARRHLTGIPDAPLTPYQQVNRWVVNPWYDQSIP
ncbi:MAG: hypothetical protein HUJ26_23185 [Planctomycetaceae bacterium]|nr:hypothetical protein [Planctomycetaceae bacterium]